MLYGAVMQSLCSVKSHASMRFYKLNEIGSKYRSSSTILKGAGFSGGISVMSCMDSARSGSPVIHSVTVHFLEGLNEYFGLFYFTKKYR